VAKKKNRGRPTSYTYELGMEICLLLCGGDDGDPQSLTTILKNKKFPSKTSILRWVFDVRDESFKDFRYQYALARAMQAELYADEIIDTAKDRAKDQPLPNGKGGYSSDTTGIQRDKLIVDALKWVVCRLLPKAIIETVETPKDQLQPLTVQVVDNDEPKPT